MIKTLLLLLALCGSAQAGTQGSGFGNATMFKATNTIVGMYPCRVIQSTTTANLTEATSVATSLGVSMAGSTVTLAIPVQAGSFARVCAFFQLSKDNNNGTGIFGVGSLLNNGTTAVFIGKNASATRPLWAMRGYANTVIFSYFGGPCWTHTVPLTAGLTYSASFQLMSTHASDTTTMFGSGNANNWFTLQEVSCPD